MVALIRVVYTAVGEHVGDEEGALEMGRRRRERAKSSIGIGAGCHA